MIFDIFKKSIVRDEPTILKFVDSLITAKVVDIDLSDATLTQAYYGSKLGYVTITKGGIDLEMFQSTKGEMFVYDPETNEPLLLIYA